MSITICTHDTDLARLLYLEARRQGFSANGEPSILFLDLDHFSTPADPPAGAVVIGLSKYPDSLSPARQKGVYALLSLPLSVTEMAEILYRFRGYVTFDRVERTDRTLRLNGKPIPLSATEWRLFDLLYEQRDRVVSDAELNAVLGDGAQHTNTLAVYLYRLRRKLSADGVTRLRRVRGKGYQWIESR